MINIENDNSGTGFDQDMHKKEFVQDMNTLLVIDLGGGSFSTTCYSGDTGLLEGRSTCGHPSFGGVDIDRDLAEHYAKQFEEETGIDCRSDHRAMRRLMAEC